MNNNFRRKVYFVILFLAIFSIIELPTGFFRSKISLLLASDKSVILNIKSFPEGFSTICPDGNSPIVFEVSVYDLNQNPVPFSLIHVELHNFSGIVKPRYPITGKDGKCIIRVYPESVKKSIENDNTLLELSALILFSTKKSSPATYQVVMTYPPILLVHGFQDTSESMVPLSRYLESNGFSVYSIDYSTETDIDSMSNALKNALSLVKKELKEKGIHTYKVDIVAHSLGGLVARYYTSQQSYIEKGDIRKLIFINTPHHGTPWAEAGAKLLGSPYLKELYPTSPLFSFTFPNSINKGLNHTLQIANIALENDEVVPLPSSSLSLWNIETKIYRIGSEPLTLESIIQSQISGGTRHRQLLFYRPVFEEILFYLTNDLPYPQKRNKPF